MADRKTINVRAVIDEKDRHVKILEDGQIVLDRLTFTELRDLVQQLIAASFYIGTPRDLLLHLEEGE